MTTVSVIVPVYNVEKYLRQCLDSLVNQTLKDMEIICLNDGSTDSSAEILNEYADKYSQIKVIHKQNSGYGATMNMGLEKACGEYIGIVESDDWAEENMFERLYNLAKDNVLDLARCQYYEYKTSEHSNKLINFDYVEKNSVYTPIDKTTVFEQPPSIWANIFKTSMIRDNNIRFLETPGASYQDTSFAFKLYGCSKRFMMINDALIHYRVDNESSSINSKSKTFCVCGEFAEIERFAKIMNLYCNLKYLIPKLKYACYSWNYNRLFPDMKWMFLKKISKEYLGHFLRGEIRLSGYIPMWAKRMIAIGFFPYTFKNKEQLSCL